MSFFQINSLSSSFLGIIHSTNFSMTSRMKSTVMASMMRMKQEESHQDWHLIFFLYSGSITCSFLV